MAVDLDRLRTGIGDSAAIFWGVGGFGAVCVLGGVMWLIHDAIWAWVVIGIGLLLMAAAFIQAWRRGAPKPAPPSPRTAPSAIEIIGGSDIRVSQNTSIGSPVLRAENVERLDAEENLTIMPPGEPPPD